MVSDPTIAREALFATRELQDSQLKQEVADFLERDRPIHNRSFDQTFQLFSREESAASGLPKKHISRPSGLFNGSAKLTIVAHYPTFRVKNVNWGETADEGSPSIKLILDAGLEDIPGFCRHRPNAEFLYIPRYY